MRDSRRRATERRKPSDPAKHSDTELLVWFERDRAHVELRNKLDDSTVVEWWDGDVAEAIEDGSLDPRNSTRLRTRMPMSADCCQREEA